MQKNEGVLVGADVSKAHVDMALHGEVEVRRVVNGEQGIQGLVAELVQLSPALVVLEATGGFEMPAAAALAAAEVPVVIANPRQTRDFARSTGQLSKTVQSVPGVGPNLSRTLIAELPELGTLTHKQIAVLVGVAPRARDSGKFRGKRMIWGGRAPVRTALYLSVWSASRWKPVIRRFYERLRAQGKPPKVTQTACKSHSPS